MTLVCVALVCLTGLGLLRFLFPGPLRWSLHNLLLMSLGAGAGMGIASCLYFLTLVLAGPNLAVLAALEAAVLIAAVVLAMRAKPRGDALSWTSGPAVTWYLTALFFAVAALAAILFLTHSASKPHGEWDAWSIWNLRARLLFRSGELWKNAFSSQIAWSHPDYPVLVPGVIAMSWTLARSESTAVPIAVAFLFTFATAGVLVASLGALRGKAQAWVGGALLLGTVAFVEIGAMQYADVPLSFYILATLALLCLQDRYPGDSRFTILAGLTAGLAAWTKNEGLLFVVAVVAARAFAIFRFGNRTALARQLGALAAGLAFPLAILTFFKLRFAPPNDLTSKNPAEIIAHVTDFGRWVTVVVGFVKAALSLGSFLIPIVLVLALYWYLVRFHVEERDRLPLATAAVALGVMFLGDFAVYILLSNDVNWQVNTSVDRVFLQLWPAGLLAFFLAAKAPQLAAQPKVAEKSKAARHGSKPHRRAAETR
ncbi:MAG: glycosyltransferase family 39 protein [Acidobacteriia bacterium]|nr:glycosyltransferase family 39 protein [Terriglobia bacterium]